MAILAGCAGGSESAAAPATTTPVPASMAQDTVPNPTPSPTMLQALGAREASLGTYAVAKPEAGVPGDDVPGLASRRLVPVYDEPNGLPRTLVAINDIDLVDVPFNLVNYDDASAVLALRVIAMTHENEWLLVQAPTRPHDKSIWVRGDDFDVATTAMRIEIDLADAGQLQVFDGETEVLRSAVAQGRSDWPTPVHVTYIETGVLGERVRPAFGHAILSMASFSESLATYGNGGMPSNFIYEAVAPQVLGERVSSGSIRMPGAVLRELIDLVGPGTPVLLFDSSDARPGRNEILQRVTTPAATVPFDSAVPGPTDVVAGIVPELWGRCPEDQVGALVCPSDGQAEVVVVAPFAALDDPRLHEHVFAVARPGAGDNFLLVGEQPPENPGELAKPVIAVFDEPGGPPRSLIYENDRDGIALDYPLYDRTVFGSRLVLSVIEMTSDGKWLRVRAPVRPHNQAVWVEGRHFELQSTTLRIEIDLGYELLDKRGRMTVWDGSEEVLSALISSGRESRPTVTTSTYVDQVIDGTTLSPAYGPWLFSTPSFSDTLGTFGGGGVPQQAIHGIADVLAVDHMGVPSSSGSIHVATSTILRMAEFDLLGAPVYIYDSSVAGESRTTTVRQGARPAVTKPIEQAGREAPIPSFT